MKSAQHFFFLLFLGLPFFTKAQVPIQGNLNLGDTTQTHVLNTTNGDRFTGLVTGFDQQQIRFRYRGSELVFAMREVALIEVAGQNGQANEMGVTPMPQDPNSTDSLEKLLVEPITKQDIQQYIWPFEYRVITKEGNEYTGILTRMNALGAVLGKTSTVPLSLEKIKSVKLMGERIDQQQATLNEHHRLKTTRGSIFTGQLLSFDGKEYIFLMENGSELKFPSWEVEYVYLVNKKSQQERAYVWTDPYPHRYHNQQRVFFTPTAFLLEEGVKEYRTMLISNNIDYGVTDNITLGVGLNTVIVASGLTAKLKIGASLNKYIHFAVGAQGMFAFSVWDTETVSMGLAYGAFSIGTREKFINVGIGRGNDTQSSGATTAYTLGGSMLISPHWRMYFEYMNFRQDNRYSFYDYTETTSMGTLGLSWFKRQHQIDFGLHINEWFDSSIVPVIGYSLRF